MAILEHLIRNPAAWSPPAEADDATMLASFVDHLRACPYERSVDRALWAGAEADRLGFAFVGGYAAALERLITTSGAHAATASCRRSLCATEAGGAHPKAIATQLAPSGEPGSWLLRGEKTFATLASVAEELLVVATTGRDDAGRQRLRLVRVRTDAPGVVVENRPATTFTPEVPHAIVRLTDVTVRDADVLPGDGWTEYVKPFRTIEDLHVLAATLAYVTRAAAAHGMAHDLVEGTLAGASALRGIADDDPRAPATHLVLAGVFDAARRLLDAHESEWSHAAQATAARWRRDRPLLEVAGRARVERTHAAWRTLVGS